MFRLTREVRFSIDPDPLAAKPGRSANGHAGVPPLRGLAHFFTIQVTLAGTPDTTSSYLKNIKDIDTAVQREAMPIVEAYIRHARYRDTALLALRLFDQLRQTFANVARVRLALSPYTAVSATATEHPMIRFSHKFEFSAAHRLHNPALDEKANAQTFGKCNNPLGHGHNYELQVTLRGKPDAGEPLIGMETLEQTVATYAIDKLDHKYLNLEVEEFKTLNPTVENIAMVIYRWLKPRFGSNRADLAAVTVWETPKTWCEYSE